MPRKRTPEAARRAKARARQQKYIQRLRGTVEGTASLTSLTGFDVTIPDTSPVESTVKNDASLTRLEAAARALRKGFAQRFEREGAGQWMQPNHPAVMDLARWALSIPEDKRREVVGRALDNFFRDSYARKAGYPVRLLALSPQKYVLGETPAPAPVVDPELEALRKKRREREQRPWN
jgi:hypothetical protein